MSAKTKEIRQRENVNKQKISKHEKDPDSYLTKNPIWAFSRCDFAHERWGIDKCEWLYKDIILKLVAFEGQTWGEIISASGGRTKGTNHHFINVGMLISEAQKRISYLHLDVDQVFSLRLTGSLRLYGVLENQVFNILWYDPLHEICISNKKHT